MHAMSRFHFSIRVLALGGGAVLGLLFSGCTMSKTTYEDAPLAAVKFESVQASQTFYNAILAGYFPVQEDGSKQSNDYSANLDVPMPLWVKHDTTESYRVIVNEAVAKADVNHDGVITEAEAEAFAAEGAAKSAEPDKK